MALYQRITVVDYRCNVQSFTAAMHLFADLLDAIRLVPVDFLRMLFNWSVERICEDVEIVKTFCHRNHGDVVFMYGKALLPYLQDVSQMFLNPFSTLANRMIGSF